MKWYKMYVKAMQDIKFKKLSKMAKQPFPYYWTAWCTMLDYCSERGGTMSYSDRDEKEIIFECLQLSLSEIDDIIDDFEYVGLINFTEDLEYNGEITIINWAKYQSVEYHSTPRVQKHRANKEHEENIDTVLRRFNEIADSNYSLKTDSHRKLISGRLNDGHSVETLLAVVAWKHKDWSKRDDMKKYIRPSTLFNPGKFDNYLNEIPKDLMNATVDGSLLRVRNIQGGIEYITQEQYDKASLGYYDIIE